MLHRLLATTEDVIDIGDLDYEWQLSEASGKLEKFVKSFKLYKIGLNDDVSTKVCPEANIELYECMQSTTNDNVEAFYQDCLVYINEIFQKGADDLKKILGTIFQVYRFRSKKFLDDEYFPQYVSEPVEYWLSGCDRARNDVEMYSDDFLQTFEKSDFFTMCKKTVEGKLQWKEWGDCSVSCGGGFQTKIASSCIPDYAVCYDIPIQERACNDQACPIGQWTWNDWSECTATCGGGFRFKTAQSCEPLGAECHDTPVLKEACNTMDCPDGAWTWNDWGECSNSCGGGIRIRTADQCLPKGAYCEEVPIMEEACNEDACPEGQWNWNPWSDCSVSCGGGKRTRTPNSCVPENSVCNDVPIIEETCNEDACPVGTWTWNEWGDCSVSCGGGVRTRIPKSCEPKNAICHDIQIMEESCNHSNCPDMPSQYLPPGTIISWVPRPNKNAPNSFNFDDDTWIECNGIEKCTSGRFEGQFCSDLSDRVLVGAGKLGQILELKDASLPDHAHEHRHSGTGTYNLQYKRGPDTVSTKKKGHDSSYASTEHNHNHVSTTSVTVDFSKMNTATAFISHITNPKISKSTEENNLYSPHIRVKFMFKCY